MSLTRMAFVPSAGRTRLPIDYWPSRAATHIDAVLSSIVDVLLSRVWLVAIGVGRAGASPFNALFVQEISDTVARSSGIACSYMLGSRRFSSNARFWSYADAILNQLVNMSKLLPLFFPQNLLSVTLFSTVFGTLRSISAAPANEALWAHLQQSTDSRERAELGRINSNQVCVVTLITIVMRFYVLHRISIDEMWITCTVVFALSMARIAVGIFKAWVAAPPKVPVDDRAHKTSPPPGGFAWARVFFSSVLLPCGHPASCAPEYLHYQAWDTLQVLCNDLRSAVTTQALLVAVGVGSATATANDAVEVDVWNSMFAAALSLFVGCIFRADLSASRMKSWRLYSAGASFLSATLVLMEGFFPAQRLGFRLCGTLFTKSVERLSGGASSALILHLSNQSSDAGFRADVKVKEGNQDRVLGLVLVAVRLMIMKVVGQQSPSAAISVIVLASIFHLIFNYLAASCLVLPKRIKCDCTSYMASSPRCDWCTLSSRSKEKKREEKKAE